MHAAAILHLHDHHPHWINPTFLGHSAAAVTYLISTTNGIGAFLQSRELWCYSQMDGSTLLGNVLRVDRANERKERPAFDSSRGPPPSSRYEGEQLHCFGVWSVLIACKCVRGSQSSLLAYLCQGAANGRSERPAFDSSRGPTPSSRYEGEQRTGLGLCLVCVGCMPVCQVQSVFVACVYVCVLYGQGQQGPPPTSRYMGEHFTGSGVMTVTGVFQRHAVCQNVQSMSARSGQRLTAAGSPRQPADTRVSSAVVLITSLVYGFGV
jgi:hypothetical protein